MRFYVNYWTEMLISVKNELVAKYELNLVPFIRLFKFGNETEILRSRIK